MSYAKKQKSHQHDAHSVYGAWPTRAIPTLDPTLLPYAWSYGSGALVDERKLLRTLMQKGTELRLPVLDWPCLPASYERDGIGFLGMFLSDKDVFVDSQVKRNMLVDRAHQYFNLQWKFEVQALCSNLNDGLDHLQRTHMQFLNYQRTEIHLYKVVDTIDLMRDIHDRLKPETVDLIKRSHTHRELTTSMLMPTESVDNYFL